MISLAPSIAVAAGDRIVSGVLEGTAIAVVVYLLLRLAPQGNSRTRFMVWYLTLMAIVALPLTYWREVGPSAAVPALPHLTLPGAWASYALAAWAAISLLGLLRIARGLCKLHSLKRRCRRLAAADLPAAAWQGVAGLSGHRRIQYCVSDEANAPTAIGFFRPAVVLPRWTIDGLSAEELNRVLLHEVGHLQRWDDWTNLAQKILRAVLFFHPAVWWIDSRLALERESACDDLVLSQAPDVRAYAECLISVAEKSRLRRGVALAVAAVGRVRQIAVRLTRILDSNRARGTGLSKMGLGCAGVLGLTVLFVFPRLPDFVEFQNAPRLTMVGAASASGAGQRMIEINKLAAGRAGEFTVRIVPVAMPIPERGVSHRKLAQIRGRGARAEQKQHRASSPTLILTKRQMILQPTFLVLVEARQYDVASRSAWIVRVASDALSTDYLDSQVGFQNGTLRVLRLTIFSQRGVVGEEVLSSVI